MLFNFAPTVILLLVSAVSQNLLTQVWGTSLAARRVPVPTNNWGGAILLGDFNEVSAIIKVPVLRGPSGSAGAAWVGMDGVDSCYGLFRTGVGFSLDDAGTPHYDVWYQWREQDTTMKVPYDGISIAAGDMVKFTLGKYTAGSGYVNVNNLSNNSANEAQTNMVSSKIAPLCGNSAEWVVEEYGKEDDDGSFTNSSYLNFGAVGFTEATAIGSSGAVKPGDGAMPVNIFQNNHSVTTTEIDGFYVRVQYSVRGVE